MSEHIQISRDHLVQVIRIARPEKKNALTRDMYAAMTRALMEGDADEGVRTHLLLGQPGMFSSGNDIADFIAVAQEGALGGEVLAFLEALAGVKKPLVSGVDGIAVGIGTTVNLHCDLTFATSRTVFRTPFVELGLVPEAGSSLLYPAAIGGQRAFAALVMGEPLSAQEAQAAGLIYRIVGEELLEATAMQAAQKLASLPPEAVRQSKALLKAPREPLLDRIREEASLFGERLSSREAMEAFQAFMSRKAS
ncbi:crotonase/enoyl-CoA hydratase family protein [Limoniibacter endophyticus]|uniref:Enoyl-CoA hydratase n=1 Tax=Limoniibacter endophyticus TaxID=1565040 RepID=A0A8J3GGY5_9HYPH|nr:crotonase/enoyl-CoA hydratase family protein [Limoniibacter endophyticus]GHC71412.1 enoyl-CoA hydratase [Limoniibacter endophyticus]